VLFRSKALHNIIFVIARRPQADEAISIMY
jgi:hypothetical protein